MAYALVAFAFAVSAGFVFYSYLAAPVDALGSIYTYQSRGSTRDFRLEVMLPALDMVAARFGPGNTIW